VKEAPAGRRLARLGPKEQSGSRTQPLHSAVLGEGAVLCFSQITVRLISLSRSNAVLGFVRFCQRFVLSGQRPRFGSFALNRFSWSLLWP
jgi:hypothetical protein